MGLIDSIMVGPMRVLMRDQPEPQRTALKLSIGELIKGKVIKNLPDGRSLISLKGTNIVTRAKVALIPGEEIFARVRTTGKEVVLALFSRQVKLQAGFLRQMAASCKPGSSIGELAAQMARMVDSLRGSKGLLPAEASLIDRILSMLESDGKTDAKSIASRLQGLIKALGLSYESSVAKGLTIGTPILLLKRRLKQALKPNLLKLIDSLSQRLLGQKTLEPADQAQLLKLLTLTKSLHGNIEFQQLANHFLSEQEVQLYLQLPAMFAGENGSAELTIGSPKEHSKGGKINPKHCQIAILVDMSGLGRVKAIASIIESKVSLLFATEQKFVAELINSHSTELAERLQAAGLTVSSMQVIVSPEPLPRMLESFGSLFASQGPTFDVTA